MSTVRDREIVGAVQRAIDREGRLHLGDRIHVQAENGVVQLTGVVCSAREAQALEETARQIPGVRRVVSALTVSVDRQRSDGDLQAEVEQVLLQSPELGGNVGCVVVGGVARLIGHIQHPGQESLAIRVAGSVHGVEDVVSDLVISESVPVTDQLPLDDATLTGRVADALTAANVTIYDGMPRVSGGVATLTGKVNSSAERQRAGRAVAGVDGLRAIKNRLVVRRDVASSDPDEALAARILQALHDDGRVSPRAVTVQVSDGAVVLGGVVNSPSDQAAAAEVVRLVPGVKSVVNQIVLSEWHATDRFVGRGPEEEKYL